MVTLETLNNNICSKDLFFWKRISYKDTSRFNEKPIVLESGPCQTLGSRNIDLKKCVSDKLANLNGAYGTKCVYSLVIFVAT